MSSIQIICLENVFYSKTDENRVETDKNEGENAKEFSLGNMNKS